MPLSPLPSQQEKKSFRCPLPRSQPLQPYCTINLPPQPLVSTGSLWNGNPNQQPLVGLCVRLQWGEQHPPRAPAQPERLKNMNGNTGWHCNHLLNKSVLKNLVHKSESHLFLWYTVFINQMNFCTGLFLTRNKSFLRNILLTLVKR